MTDVIDTGSADGLEAEPDVDLGDAGSLGEIRRAARYDSLAGGVVVITGGASGIGASMTAHFAAQGARVAVFDRNIAPLEPLGAVLATAGWPVPLAIEVDLTDIEAARAAVAKVEGAFGPVTVLVNNAANDDRHGWREVTPAYWDERMAVNLRHQFFLAQAVAPAMAAAGGGSIINLTSTSFMIGVPDLPVYQTAKAAIIGMTRALARDLGGMGIRVNAVAPGWVMTARQKALWADPVSVARMIDRQCLKEEMRPADLARMVLFLAAADSRLCTAQTFIVDGGAV